MTKKSKIVVCIVVILSFLLGTVAGIFIGRKTELFKFNESPETVYEDKNMRFEITNIQIINPTFKKPFLFETYPNYYLVIDYSFTNKMNKSIAPNEIVELKLFNNGNLVQGGSYSYLFKNENDNLMFKKVGELQSGAQADGRISFALADNYNEISELNLNDRKTEEIYKTFQLNTKDINKQKITLKGMSN